MSVTKAPRMLLAAALAVAAISSAQAESAGDIYAKKTIRMIVTYEPGGSYDIYARLVASHMGRHLPNNPSIVPQYMPGAGGLTGTLHFNERAARDGTEIAVLPRDIAINQMLRPDQARYDARRF